MPLTDCFAQNRPPRTTFNETDAGSNLFRKSLQINMPSARYFTLGLHERGRSFVESLH